jgi:hypothetical protein
MVKLTNYLEEKGLFTPESIRNFVLLRPLTEVVKVREELLDLIRTEEESIPSHGKDPIAFYNFMASATLRGDCCKNWKCRLEKMRVLGRYGVLYADQLLVPFWLEPEWDNPEEEDIRGILLGGLLAASELRPAIDSGIIKPIQHRTGYCSKCETHVVPNYAQIGQVAAEMTDEELGRFRFVYEPPSSSENASLTISGPRDYFEHGTTTVTLITREPWDVELAREYSNPVRLRSEFVRKHKLADYVFTDLTDDVVLQSYNGMRFGCKYLAQLPSEAGLFARVGRLKKEREKNRILAAKLSHNLPIVRDLPVATLLRLRQDEEFAFANYRAALERIVRDRLSDETDVSEGQADEIYEDCLRDPLLKLRSKLVAAESRARKRKMIKATAWSAVALGVGWVAGMLPSELMKMFQSVPGCNYVKDLVSGVVEPTEHGQEEVSNDVYFLLRASEELSD